MLESDLNELYKYKLFNISPYFLKYKKSTHTHILYFLKMVFDFSFSHLLWLGEQHFSKNEKFNRHI